MHPAAADAAAEDTLAAYATAAPLAGKSVGHTSVAWKLKLDGNLEAAYKPRSHRGGARYRGEIAAYRLAQALGLPNVPRAIPRSFSLTALRGALEPGSAARDLLDNEVVADASGAVTGALIPWITGLEFLPLETDEWGMRWRGWLGGGEVIPDDQRALAAQISTMIVFDYLTGNWDRWSGGQIGIDRKSGTLLFLDNDGAFFDPPPPAQLAQQLARLTKIWCFPRRFVAALRRLDENAALAAIGEESPGAPLLSPRVLRGLEDRRTGALSIVDAKISERGEARVLPFDE